MSLLSLFVHVCAAQMVELYCSFSVSLMSGCQWCLFLETQKRNFDIRNWCSPYFPVTTNNTTRFLMGCLCWASAMTLSSFTVVLSTVFLSFFLSWIETFFLVEIRWSVSSMTERMCGNSHLTSSLWRNTFTSRARETSMLLRDHGKLRWPGKVWFTHSSLIR